MKIRYLTAKNIVVALATTSALIWSLPAAAHCDTLDGPVVAAARKALDTGNVNLVLVWVQKKDDADIRKHFEKTVAVRKASGQAKELAAMYFFETLVRIHRAGEGATDRRGGGASARRAHHGHRVLAGRRQRRRRRVAPGDRVEKAGVRLGCDPYIGRLNYARVLRLQQG